MNNDKNKYLNMEIMIMKMINEIIDFYFNDKNKYLMEIVDFILMNNGDLMNKNKYLNK